MACSKSCIVAKDECETSRNSLSREITTMLHRRGAWKLEVGGREGEETEATVELN